MGKASPRPKDTLAADLKIPLWAWWSLGLFGVAFRLVFVFHGNIAFNSDQAMAADYIHKKMTGDLGDFAAGHDFAGYRLGVACVFHSLTGNWVQFGSLAGIFMTFGFSLIWVRWVHHRISKAAAFGMAVLLAFPPLCSIYYSTHFEERRMETLFWASLLVLFSGGWLTTGVRASLLGVLVGWAYCCEPFIIFFALPVLGLELWGSFKTKKKSWGNTVFSLAGFMTGLSAGWSWNRPFVTLGARYLQWGVEDREGMARHWGILTQAYPQFWNANFPFGYLQDSGLGRALDPVRGGGYSVFLVFWTFFTFLVALVGFLFLIGRKSPHGWGWACIMAGPALAYILFFIFSAQIWDATSLRYLSYLPVWAAMGWGLVFVALYPVRKRWAWSLLVLWIGVQGTVTVLRYITAPAISPAERIVEGFENLGLKAGFADFWVAEAATYLSGNKVHLMSYTRPISWRVYQAAHHESRVGCAILEGLDRTSTVQEQIAQLESEGYKPVRKWTMEGHWAILELQKKVPGSKAPKRKME